MLSCWKLGTCWKATEKIVEIHDTGKDAVENLDDAKAKYADTKQSRKRLRHKQTIDRKLKDRQQFVPGKDEQKQTRFSKTCPRLANACRRRKIHQ